MEGTDVSLARVLEGIGVMARNLHIYDYKE